MADYQINKRVLQVWYDLGKMVEHPFDDYSSLRGLDEANFRGARRLSIRARWPSNTEIPGSPLDYLEKDDKKTRKLLVSLGFDMKKTRGSN
jgi:hypothetical protein